MAAATPRFSYAVSAAAVLLNLAVAVAAPPATKPLPRLELRVLTPPHAQPAAYPVLVSFELVNRSAVDYENPGTFEQSAFDIELTDDAGRVTRRPLAPGVGGRSGILRSWSLGPGEAKAFTGSLGRLPVGRYQVRLINRPPDEETPRVLTGNPATLPAIAISRDAFQPVTPTAGVVRVDDSAETREKWLADTRERLHRLDRFVARWALVEDVAPLHDTLVEMLADPTSPRCAFAAHVFRSVWRGKPDPAADEALAHAVAAADALPINRRDYDTDSALMALTLSAPQPRLLDTIIRWSRPGGSPNRYAALMALQAYKTEPTAIEAVAALLDDTDRSLAEFAARLLCVWRLDERAIPVLVKHAFMTEGGTSQPYIYFHLLIRYGRHPQVLAAFERGLKEPRPEIADEARAALKRLPPDQSATKPK